MNKPLALALLATCLGIAGARSPGDGEPLGLFEGHADVGMVLHAGSADYDAGTKSYSLSGSGENMWFATDEFQYVWKRVSGDVSLSADVSLLGNTGEPHRKGVLMVRQSLDTDSAYADVARHGDGLTSLQFRDAKGGVTHEIEANISGPTRLRIEKRGDLFYMFVGARGEELPFAGGSARVMLKTPFYVGIGVCAHNKDAVQKALFSNVELQEGAGSGAGLTLYSTIETITVASTDARVAYLSPERLEAPGWSRDGSELMFKSKGEIRRVAVTGGEARQVTGKAPLYWQSFSPDRKTLAFAQRREGKSDVYSASIAGGPQKRLTGGVGTNDNPEFSPDGAWIYFNSDRGGTMQIWRMRADGTQAEQVTSDELNNAYPHLSPDGQRLVFLSYAGAAMPYPQDTDVALRVMTLSDKKVQTLAKLVGGQGSLNASSWSPDSKRLAFISYQMTR